MVGAGQGSVSLGVGAEDLGAVDDASMRRGQIRASSSSSFEVCRKSAARDATGSYPAVSWAASSVSARTSARGTPSRCEASQSRALASPSRACSTARSQIARQVSGGQASANVRGNRTRSRAVAGQGRQRCRGHSGRADRARCRSPQTVYPSV